MCGFKISNLHINNYVNQPEATSRNSSNQGKNLLSKNTTL